MKKLLMIIFLLVITMSSNAQIADTLLKMQKYILLMLQIHLFKL